jgi:hypothetical protein
MNNEPIGYWSPEPATNKPQILSGGEEVQITCTRRAAHDLVLGFMLAKQNCLPFSSAATELIEELSAALIGRGAKP